MCWWSIFDHHSSTNILITWDRFLFFHASETITDVLQLKFGNTLAIYFDSAPTFFRYIDHWFSLSDGDSLFWKVWHTYFQFQQIFTISIDLRSYYYQQRVSDRVHPFRLFLLRFAPTVFLHPTSPFNPLHPTPVSVSTSTSPIPVGGPTYTTFLLHSHPPVFIAY